MSSQDRAKRKTNNMYYEINVSKNGSHYFATAERSIQTHEKAVKMYEQFTALFPKEDGYNIMVTKYEQIGYGIDMSNKENK